MAYAPAQDHPVAGLHQHARGRLQQGMVHRLDHAREVIPVAPHHFAQGAEHIRGHLQAFQLGIAGAGAAGLPQGIPEVAEALVAQALGEAHHRADTHLRPLGHGLDAPERPQQRIAHEQIGNGPLRIGELSIETRETNLDFRSGGCMGHK